MLDNHDTLVRIAEEAIYDIFNDTSVDSTTTKDSLLKLISEMETLINCIDNDLYNEDEEWDL